MTDQIRDVAAFAFAVSFVGFILLLLYFGIKYISQKIKSFQTVESYKQETKEQIAAYKAQVEELKLKVQATEVHA